MSKNADRIRRMLSDHERGRGRRYPEATRRAVVAYAIRRREEGASWAAIANELGLWFETVRRWCEARDLAAGSASEIVPVEVVDEARLGDGGEVVIVSPSGYRLEGLDARTAVAALRALG